jgi:hypothetical protein
MICPNCQSSDLRNVSLVHAAGAYESSGHIRGLFLGGADGLLFGRYRGTNQSRLSSMVRPPMRLPFVQPVILWLVCFFPLMAFVGGGKLSILAGLAYISFLHIFLERCSTTSSFAQRNTRCGKARSCANGAGFSSSLSVQAKVITTPNQRLPRPSEVCPRGEQEDCSGNGRHMDVIDDSSAFDLIKMFALRAGCDIHGMSSSSVSLLRSSKRISNGLERLISFSHRHPVPVHRGRLRTLL